MAVPLGMATTVVCSLSSCATTTSTEDRHHSIAELLSTATPATPSCSGRVSLGSGSSGTAYHFIKGGCSVVNPTTWARAGNSSSTHSVPIVVSPSSSSSSSLDGGGGSSEAVLWDIAFLLEDVPILEEASGNMENATQMRRVMGRMLSAIGRLKLEAQWALSLHHDHDHGGDNNDSDDETEQLFPPLDGYILPLSLSLPLPPLPPPPPPTSDEKLLNDEPCQKLDTVRSSGLSARERRFYSKYVKEFPAPKLEHSASEQAGLRSSRRVRKVKSEAVQGFVFAYLKPVGNSALLTKVQEEVLSKQMKFAQSLNTTKMKLWKELGHEPSHEFWAESLQISSKELTKKLDEGEKARKKVLAGNMRLVVKIAKQYQNNGLDVVDLIQEGTKGLLRGLEKFDHTRGLKISTYIHWWIRQAVTRAIAEHSRILRLPVYMHANLIRIKRQRKQLISAGENPSLKNLSNALNMPRKKVEIALKASRRVKSIDEPKRFRSSNNVPHSMHEFIPDQDLEYQPWSRVEEESLKKNMAKLFAPLDLKEREVIQAGFGVAVNGSLYQPSKIIRNRYGLSKDRFEEVQKSAIRKLEAQHALIGFS